MHAVAMLMLCKIVPVHDKRTSRNRSAETLRTLTSLVQVAIDCVRVHYQTAKPGSSFATVWAASRSPISPCVTTCQTQATRTCGCGCVAPSHPYCHDGGVLAVKLSDTTHHTSVCVYLARRRAAIAGRARLSSGAGTHTPGSSIAAL